MADREHDVRGMTDGELHRARRGLELSLARAFPGSPVRVPILEHLSAIEAELADRPRSTGTGGPVIYLCSCGFGTDDPAWFDGHLFQHPGHNQRPRMPVQPGHHRL
jgi:hypothetical protein